MGGATIPTKRDPCDVCRHARARDRSAEIEFCVAFMRGRPCAPLRRRPRQQGALRPAAAIARRLFQPESGGRSRLPPRPDASFRQRDFCRVAAAAAGGVVRLIRPSAQRICARCHRRRQRSTRKASSGSRSSSAATRASLSRRASSDAYAHVLAARSMSPSCSDMACGYS